MTNQDVPRFFMGQMPEGFTEQVISEYNLPRRGRVAKFLNRLFFPHTIPDEVVADMLARSLWSVNIAREGEEFARRQAELGMYDDITGLLNRDAFHREVKSRLAELERSSSDDRRRLIPNSALLIHLDGKGQKTVNDNKGHDAGDENLRGIGNTLLKVARPGDIVARTGGDEFAALLFYRSDLVAPDEMKINVDTNLYEFFKQVVDSGEVSGAKWASVNWEHGMTKDELLKAADPIRSNPNLIEYPSKDILPDRSVAWI